MNTPSANDLLKKELPWTAEIADSTLDELITLHEPKKNERNAATVERALRRIMAELQVAHSGFLQLFARIGELKEIATAKGMEGSRQVRARVTKLLEDTFGSDIGKESAAEATAHRIAESHARFHAKISAMLAKVQEVAAAPHSQRKSGKQTIVIDDHSAQSKQTAVPKVEAGGEIGFASTEH